MSFAQRMGFRPTRSVMQLEELDHETRTELWNVLFLVRGMTKDEYQSATDEAVTEAMWAWVLKEPRDEQPATEAVWRRLKALVLGGDWFDVLDLVEAYGKFLSRLHTPYMDEAPGAFEEILNKTLEQYLVGYRLIEGKLVPIDNQEAAAAVADAFAVTDRFEGARYHLTRATELLSDRHKPDYANSVKESISAVESIVRSVTGEGTLGAGLKKLGAYGTDLHPALAKAWSTMYGWTSDADGIRHSAIEEADADQSIAKYMLIACSAFVSYIIEAGRKTNSF